MAASLAAAVACCVTGAAYSKRRRRSGESVGGFAIAQNRLRDGFCYKSVRGLAGGLLLLHRRVCLSDPFNPFPEAILHPSRRWSPNTIATPRPSRSRNGAEQPIREGLREGLRRFPQLGLDRRVTDQGYPSRYGRSLPSRRIDGPWGRLHHLLHAAVFILHSDAYRPPGSNRFQYGGARLENLAYGPCRREGESEGPRLRIGRSPRSELAALDAIALCNSDRGEGAVRYSKTEPTSIVHGLTDDGPIAEIAQGRSALRHGRGGAYYRVAGPLYPSPSEAFVSDHRSLPREAPDE